MSDLVVGLFIIAGIAILMFLTGCQVGARFRPRTVNLIGFLTTIALVGYLTLLRDDLLLARLLPYSSLIVLGNWLPVLLSFLSGIVWAWIPRSVYQGTSVADCGTNLVPKAPPDVLPVDSVTWKTRVRQTVCVGFLQCLGWWRMVENIAGSPPKCLNQWEDGICLQTDQFTCSAACAATLLRAHGINTTEQEMADLCLTRREGTLWQGLYRGLKLKTAGTEWDVAVVSGSPESLRGTDGEPMILAAGIPWGTSVPAIYTEQYGWTRGELHSVLFFGFRENGLVAMGEPTPGVGRENWSEEDLRILWRGRGMRLVRR